MDKEQVLKEIDEATSDVDRETKTTWTLGFISGLWRTDGITEETYDFIHEHRVKEVKD